MHFSQSVFGTTPRNLSGCLCPQQGIGGEQTYTVRSGDSLTLITWKFNRPATDALTLYSVNSAEIGQDPNKLERGQVLYLPYGWPTTPTRSDSPNPAWINEAANALKSVGFTWTKPPKPEEPTTPPSIVITPPVVAKPKIGAIGGIAVASLLLYFGWKWWKSRN